MRISLLPTLALLLVAAPASAARPHASVSLSYRPGSYAAECPLENFFRMELAGRFGYDPFEEPSPRRHLTVTIARRSGKFQVHGEIVDEGDRKVSFSYTSPASLTCKPAVAVMGLAVAAELTTLPTVEETAPPVVVVVEAPPAATVATMEAAVVPRDAAEPPPSTVTRARVQIGAGSFLAINAAPSPTAGFVLSVGVQWPTWPGFSIAIEGMGVVPRPTEVTLDGGASAEVRTMLFTAAGVPCVHLSYFLGCGLVELGQHQFRVSDNLAAKTDTAVLYVAAGIRAGAELPLSGRFALRAYGDLLGAREPNLVVQRQAVWTPVPLVGALAIAATASF